MRSVVRRFFELGDRDRELAHIPVSVRYYPYWIRETWREQKRTAMRPEGRFMLADTLAYLKPNLEKPVFAIGAPRSGTTFLGASLGYLPEIVYFFEPVMTKAAVHHVYQNDWPAWQAAAIYRSVYAWLMRVRREPTATFCEKTPGNCFIVPFLYRTFPRARFIHIVRDGRDSALSLARKEWYANASQGKGLRDPDGYLFGSGRRFWVEEDRAAEYESTSDLHRCIWLWRCYVEHALAGLEYVPDEQVLQIRYEDFVRDTDTHGRMILDHIGIVNADSRSQFLSNLERTSHTSAIGSWREGVPASEQRRLWEEAGPLMEHFGYALE